MVTLKAAAVVVWLLTIMPMRAGHEVTVDVVGRVAPRCGIAPSRNILELGDLTQAGLARLGIEMSCNTPASVTLTAGRGMLRNDDVAKAAGFLSGLPYTVAVGHSAAARFSCPGGSMTTPAGCEGTLEAGERLTELSVSWQKSVQPLIAGVYSDVITITLSPRY